MIKIMENNNILNPNFRKFDNSDFAAYSDAWHLPDGNGPFIEDSGAFSIVLSGDPYDDCAYCLEADYGDICLGKTFKNAKDAYYFANKVSEISRKYINDDDLSYDDAKDLLSKYLNPLNC